MSNAAHHRKLFVIAQDIRSNWGIHVSFRAEPYLRAMEDLNTINDMYGADSAHEVVLYFLSNATEWRGEAARRIKKELRDMIEGFK